MSRLADRAIPFEDSEPEDVIRRLLDKTEGGEPRGQTGEISPADLVSRGGRIPHGSKLRATYKGTEYYAEIDDGKVGWNGRRFESLSKAAVAVIRSTGTDRRTENGWRFWEVKTPESNDWETAYDLRSDDERSTEELIKHLSRKSKELPEKERAAFRDILRTNRSERKKADDGLLLVCEGRGARATGKYKAGKLIVHQGSTAACKTTTAAPESTKRRRRELLENGILETYGHKDALKFMSDAEFSSPSAAACTVLGRSANGWEEWKTEDGLTLDQIERK
jgi:hypothetical protein